jgi:hypothetical protein
MENNMPILLWVVMPWAILSAWWTAPFEHPDQEHR